MVKVKRVISLLKLLATGTLAAGLGVAQVASGEQSGIVAGLGSFVVAAVIFGFIGYAVLRKPEPARREVFQFASAEKRSRLLWLGLFLCVAPGLMYLYLHYAGYQAALGAVTFLGVPIWIAGLACIAASLMPEAEERPN